MARNRDGSGRIDECDMPFVKTFGVQAHKRKIKGSVKVSGKPLEYARPRCTLHAFPIPKGLCPPAQG